MAPSGDAVSCCRACDDSCLCQALRPLCRSCQQQQGPGRGGGLNHVDYGCFAACPRQGQAGGECLTWGAFLQVFQSSASMKAPNIPGMPRSSGRQGPLQCTESGEADLWQPPHQQACRGSHCLSLRSTAAHQENPLYIVDQLDRFGHQEGSAAGGKCPADAALQWGHATHCCRLGVPIRGCAYLGPASPCLLPSAGVAGLVMSSSAAGPAPAALSAVSSGWALFSMVAALSSCKESHGAGSTACAGLPTSQLPAGWP